MARSRTPKFDASELITNEIIRIIERGVLPWRKPWTAGGSSRPLRVGGEPYQGVNNFLLTMRTVMAGHSSPFWMTLPQANALEAKVRKGEKSSVVVYYGQSRKDADCEDDRSDGDDRSEEARIFRFQKSYRVFNACQIEGLPDSFFPDLEPAPAHPPSEPIPHMQAFFDAIDITTVFAGGEAYYLPPVDKVFMPSIERFQDPRHFYGVWAHELAHATKAPHRLNRDFGLSKFGNTSYAREEIVAELTSCFLGQELGFTGVSSALIGELGDPEGATNIGALIPFFMMVLMAKGFIIATPFIVRAISGNIMMPALSGGLGGGYSFARAAMGSQQSYNRYLIGGASGAEYAALRARQFFGVQQMPVRQGMGQTGSAGAAGSADSGSKMLAQLARLGRLGRR